ncbi:hypothetical protein [Weissella confusa]|uniref:hypothetical protein n=1 Tax=Weissella confusa TaxID=1583 RepID=UPI0005E09BBA|nr:hypothetical protein [Weissella confusa]MDY2511603.1 hypothetical protein [Weissella confusa]COI16997.1 HeH/LEM domain [Streptococcus pneumoniae]
MDKFIVKSDFIDKHTKISYVAGDEYPKFPTDQRIAELKAGDFIGVVNEKPAEDETVEDEQAGVNETVEETVEKPTDKNTVADIKAYLDANKIEYADDAKKADLLALI